jgi:hypothetical protein
MPREVDAGRHGGQGRIVLRIEMLRIAHGDDACPALPFDRCAAEVDKALAGEPRGEFDGGAKRQQHGVTEMASRPV